MGTNYKKRIKKELKKKIFKKILVLPDLHSPWINWAALKQAKKWADKNKPDLIVQLGDILDQKIWSRWQSDPDDFCPSTEFNLAEMDMVKLHRWFPKMVILRGNHDERVKSKAIEGGIPSQMFKDVDDVFNYKGWKWIPRGQEFRVNTANGEILFIHGDEMGGTVAQKSRMLGVSIIQGHTHKTSITYTQTSQHHIFGAEMGCLMDIHSKAARYAQSNPVGVSVGWGVIENGVPCFHPYKELIK